MKSKGKIALATTSAFALAALTGLFSSAAYADEHAQGGVKDPAAAHADAGAHAGDTHQAGQHDCKGHNECKGAGGCKSGDNGCKGKNSCKGKGGCATNKE